MAKYLGGISNPDIDVVGVSEVEFLDFELEYYDKKNPDVLKSLCIYDIIKVTCADNFGLEMIIAKRLVLARTT